MDFFDCDTEIVDEYILEKLVELKRNDGCN